MKKKYEIGGEVQISGKWYEIVEVDGDRDDFLAPIRIAVSDDSHWVRSEFIQDYDPPAPKEWITEADWILYPNESDYQQDGPPLLKAMNRLLNEKYGEPPHAEN